MKNKMDSKGNTYGDLTKETWNKNASYRKKGIRLFIVDNKEIQCHPIAQNLTNNSHGIKWYILSRDFPKHHMVKTTLISWDDVLQDT